MKEKLEKVLPMFLFYLNYLFMLYLLKNILTIKLEKASNLWNR